MTWPDAYALVALTACGGGGDDSDSSSAVSKYVGTWTGCENYGDGTSEFTSMKLSATSDSKLDVVETWKYFEANETCAGAASDEGVFNATLTKTGTTTASGKTVDKFELLPDGESAVLKGLLLVEGNKLYGTFVDEETPTDSSGYPVTIDLVDYVSK